LAPLVRQNITRAITVFESEGIFNAESESWNESWEVIGSFFPGLKGRLLSENKQENN